MNEAKKVEILEKKVDTPNIMFIHVNSCGYMKLNKVIVWLSNYIRLSKYITKYIKIKDKKYI